MYLVPSFGDFPAPISINYIYGNIISDNVEGARYDLSEMQASSSIKGTINSDQEGPEGVSYFNENFRITTKPLEDLGCYRVKIEDYMTPAGKANNVSYTFLALAWQKKDPNAPFVNLLWGQSTRSKNPEFLLRSESNYVIYIEGTDSDGNTYIPRAYPPSYTDTADQEVLNNSYRFYLNSGTTPIQVLDLTKDLSAPYLPKNNNPFNGDPGCYTIPIPQDGNPESPLYTGPSIIKNKYGNAELAYYIIPVPTGNRKFVPSYTIEELETYYKDIKQTIEFPYDPDENFTEGKIRVPYDDLKDGFYTISFVTQDVNNNKAVETYPFIKNNLGKLPYSFEYTGMGYEFTLNPTKNPEIKLVGENLDKPSVEVYLQRCLENSETQPSYWEGCLSDNQLVYTSGQSQFGNNCFIKILDGTPGSGPLLDTCFTPNEGRWYRIKAYYGFNDSDSTSGKGFYDMEYVFIGNPGCDVKNCIEGLSGIVVYCDNTVLAHTLYSKTKLTRSKYEKDAASIWENKGAETGVWLLNTEPWKERIRPDDGQSDGWERPVKMITYNASNYDFVPTGYYFVTVFHFADGTVTMTDIKQKD
jgi:hypothetical protein